MYPVTIDDLSMVRGLGTGAFHQAVSDVHHRLRDFIRAIVVHRRDEAISGLRNWIRKDHVVHPYRWLRPDLVHSHFSSVSLVLRLVVLGCLLIRVGSMRNSEKFGFPTFAVLGKRRPVLRNSIGG